MGIVEMSFRYHEWARRSGNGSLPVAQEFASMCTRILSLFSGQSSLPDGFVPPAHWLLCDRVDRLSDD